MDAMRCPYCKETTSYPCGSVESALGCVLYEPENIIPAETSLEETLEARGNRYGEFKENAEVAQKLKAVFRESRNWEYLEPYQQEALDIIASKISRLLSGDPNYPDNWHDIQGFAKLVEDRLSK